MDRGAWKATVHEVAESWAQLSEHNSATEHSMAQAFSLQSFSCYGPRALGHPGFSSHGTWAPEQTLSRCGAQGFVAPSHVESSRTRIQPMSLEWARGLCTTEPPGKPYTSCSGPGYGDRIWKQPRCPSADEWIRKLWYIYTMEYYSAIKKDAFESVIQSEVSRKEKHHYSILMHIYGI